MNPDMSPDDDLFRQAIIRMGLATVGEAINLTPLTGGVSSDIRLLQVGARRFCAKRALVQLKVAQLWTVDTSRNAAEVAYFRTVGAWLPGFVPTLLGEDAQAGLFAMSYLEPAQHPLWKTQLLRGESSATLATEVGARLVEVHRRSAREPGLRQRFDNDALFEALRLDPYLRATAQRHPALAQRLQTLADTTGATHLALVHGDVSPKNILAGPQGPVLLDAECACFGDPAFDLAFCLNHLLLKGARAGQQRAHYAPAFHALARAYLDGVDWEPPDALDTRAATLLPALLLARIDGKSPVEYLLTEAERQAVREFAMPRVATPPASLQQVIDDWAPGEPRP
jgi:hypothetical protein